MILVVENDKNIRMAIVELLSSNGFKTITAKNGKEAIKLIDEMLPRLVISDITMPKVSGYQVLEHLRNLRLPIHIPFIFLSSKIDSSEVREGMTTGADDFLTKPFRAKDLLASVKTQLKKYNELEAKKATLYLNISNYITKEFQSPLKALIDYANTLNNEQKYIEEFEVQKALENMKKSSKKLTYVMEKFANYFKIQNRLANSNRKENTLGSLFSRTELVNEVFLRQLENNNVPHELTFNIVNQQICIPENDFVIILEIIAQYILDYSETKSKISINGITKREHYLIEIIYTEKYFKDTLEEDYSNIHTLHDKVNQNSDINLVLTAIKKLMNLYDSKIIIENSNKELSTILIQIPINKRINECS